MIYAELIDVISLADDYEDRRRTIDLTLGVASWPTPTGPRRRPVDVPRDAPAWWLGDEEASQSFMREMGVSHHAR